MDSACQTGIPKGSMMTPTTMDMTVRETYTQCVVLSNKVCHGLVWWCHNADELNSKQNIPMCSSVWSRLSPVFLWKFGCYLYLLQHDSTLKKKLHSKVFFEKWSDTKKYNKKIWEKRVGKGQVIQPNGTSWDRLEYVGQVGQGERVLQIFVGQVGQGQWVCPLDTVHLSNMGIRGRGTLHARLLELLQHCLKTFLNFESSLRFENLFKTQVR